MPLSRVRPAPAVAGYSPCLPTLAATVPAGQAWLFEIKHDDYRMGVRRAGTRLRLLTRNGADWTARYPWIRETAVALPARSFVMDGEATWCGADGVPRFDTLHARSRDAEVCLHAFDLLELDGEDLRPLPLEERKGRLATLLENSGPGIRFVDHIDGDGEAVFRHACKLGLEGIVCKRRDLPYRPGRSAAWRKVRNPQAPAATRREDGTF